MERKEKLADRLKASIIWRSLPALDRVFVYSISILVGWLIGFFLISDIKVTGSFKWKDSVIWESKPCKSLQGA